MNLPRWILDTNTTPYYLGNRLTLPLPSGNYFVSVITEIELLSYPNLDEIEFRLIRNFLNELTIIMLDEWIKESAIQWRQNHQLKLPDAIIAATTITLCGTLLTNDQQLLKLEGLQTESLPVAN